MFKYFGSKKRLAPTYAPPRHPTIIEPFAGAAAYSVYWLKQRSDLTAVVYDIDPLVIEAWSILLSMTPGEILDYPDPVKGERSDRLLWATTNSSPSPLGCLSAGRTFQVTQWMQQDWPAYKKRMAHDRAKIGDRITVVEGSYETAPDIEATWYIDPPYQHQGKWYGANNSGLDYGDLGEWCRSRRGQVIVTEAQPADWLPFIPHTAAQTQVNSTSIEVIWESDPDPNLFGDHLFDVLTQ